MEDPGLIPGWEDPWAAKSWTWLEWLTLSSYKMGFFSGSDGKDSACNPRDSGVASSIPGWKDPGEGHGNLLVFLVENSCTGGGRGHSPRVAEYGWTTENTCTIGNTHTEIIQLVQQWVLLPKLPLFNTTEIVKSLSFLESAQPVPASGFYHFLPVSLSTFILRWG